MGPVRRCLVALVVIVLAATGCTADDGEPRARPDPPDPPHPFPAVAQAPKGWQSMQCSDFRARDNSGLATRFGAPASFSGFERTPTTCSAGSSYNRSMRVTLDPAQTLLTYKERDVDPYVGPDQGDAEHGEVSYTTDVRVFGPVRGERLDYFCFCDGQNLAYRVVQASGVRLEWITPHERPVHEDEYRTVTRSLALLRSDESFCTARGGRAASFVPPIPQTQFMDGYGGGCHLYLRGAGRFEGYAEVVPAPRRTLAQVAAALERDRHVTSVRLEADRVTWTSRQYRRDWRGVTWAQAGAQVTWWDRPARFAKEADTIREFRESVRPLQGP